MQYVHDATGQYPIARVWFRPGRYRHSASRGWYWARINKGLPWGGGPYDTATLAGAAARREIEGDYDGQNGLG